MIAPEIIEKQLYRKGVVELRKKEVEFAHGRIIVQVMKFASSSKAMFNPLNCVNRDRKLYWLFE
ncbi:MAG TPA: hypothetical protein DHV26_08810 [Cytophagales bacterium]|nr:hypothetical protein [Cytophagales bacterium]